MPTTQFPATLELSDLNGKNGFRIDGEAAGDQSGISVSSAGDINADGRDDLFIGAYLADPAGLSNAGRSYVIFGNSEIVGNGVFSLSSLNGVNGFKIDGETATALSGYPVRTVGDINNDGYDDIAIGCLGCSPGGRSGAGRAYVIFGKPGIGNTGLVSLASLNGQNGFKLNGEAANDWGGYAISSAGDINNDGKDDLLIGAPLANPGAKADAGRGYVIFGGSTVGGNGNLELSSLNGVNGFYLNGVNIGDNFGRFVDSLGDINGDAIDDLIVGAPYVDTGGRIDSGRSYVIFGRVSIGGSGSVDLASLNGTNGFMLNGIASGDYSGSPVNRVGDINGDQIKDFIISSPSCDPEGRIDAGCNYVIFGHTAIGGSGVLELSNLNGTNGFTIYGIAAGDKSNSGAAGDVNQDGFDDLIIAAGSADPGGRTDAGCTYIIFGHSQIGQSGILELSALNGANGFVINGIYSGDRSDFVNYAGDVNNDGVGDVTIGAFLSSPNGKTNAGQSYVIFGDIAPELLTNRLTISEEQAIPLNIQFLNATDGNHPINALRLQASNIQHGQFELVSVIGQAVMQFTQAQVLAGQVKFVHDGSEFAPSYDIQVFSDGLALSPPSQAAQIIFTNINDAPVFINNQLTLFQGETLNVTAGELSAADIDSLPDSFIFYVNNLQHGIFHSIPQSRTVNNFLQSNISAGDIQFIHDASVFPPFYQVIVSDGQAYSPPQSPAVNFNGVNLAPVFLNNNLNIAEGQAVILSTNYLSAFDADTSADRLTFVVSNVQHGQFERVAFPGIMITGFTLQEIQLNALRFVHDNSESAPSYDVSISDGSTLVGPRSAVINYTPVNNSPMLTRNQLSLMEGESLVLNLNHLAAIDKDNPLDSLLFVISSIQQGRFEWTVNPGFAISSFSQQALNSSSVRFVHDGGELAPSYQISVSDSLLVTPPQPASIQFVNVNDAPVITFNQLTIREGESATITPSQLSIVDVDNLPSELSITPSNITAGHFEQVFNSGVSLSSFTQQDVQLGFVRFVHDGSEQAPSYSLTVSDGLLSNGPHPAVIAYAPVNDAPLLLNNQLRLIEGERVAITPAELSAADQDNNEAGLIFSLSNVAHGQFELLNAPGTTVLSFNQQQVSGNQLRFVHDGGNLASSYFVSVSDGQLTTVPQAAFIDFTPVNDAPILINHALSIDQGQSVILTPALLSASDEETPSESLLFQISNLSHGHFEYVTSPGEEISLFSQGKIETADIRFVHDGSDRAPEFSVSINDGELSSAGESALIQFTPREAVQSSAINKTNAIIGAVITGSIGFGFLLTRLLISYCVNKRLKEALDRGEATEEGGKRIAFYKNVIRPIADKIFTQLKTTGFLGYRSEEDTHAYLAAIIHLLTRLEELGVNLELKSMSQQLHLFNEITRHIQEELTVPVSKCSLGYAASFFKAEITPQQMRDKVEDLAQKISRSVEKVGPSQSGDGAKVDIEMSELKEIQSRPASPAGASQAGLFSDSESLAKEMREQFTRVNDRIAVIESRF